MFFNPNCLSWLILNFLKASKSIKLACALLSSTLSYPTFRSSYLPQLSIHLFNTINCVIYLRWSFLGWWWFFITFRLFLDYWILCFFGLSLIHRYLKIICFILLFVLNLYFFWFSFSWMWFHGFRKLMPFLLCPLIVYFSSWWKCSVCSS